MTKPPTDPRYPAHGVTVKERPYIVIDYVPDDVWNECVQLANDHGYDLFKITDDEGEIIVMKQRPPRGSFFALKPGEKGKNGVVGV